MKQIYIFSLSILFTMSAFSQKINGILEHNAYLNASGVPYVETYLLLDGNSLQYMPQSSGMQEAMVEVIYILFQAGEVLSYDKISLKSSAYNADVTSFNDLLDSRKLLAAEGNVVLETYLRDLNSPDTNFITLVDSIAIPYSNEIVELAPIRFIDMYQPTVEEGPFTRGNVDLYHGFTDIYPLQKEKLIFYTEVYNTEKFLGKGGKYLIISYIENYNSNFQLEKYTSKKRDIASGIKPYLAEFNIADLPSGNYNVVVEIRDSLNKLTAREKHFFMRNNPTLAIKYDQMEGIALETAFTEKFNDPDSLKMMIYACKPLYQGQEEFYAQNVVKNGDPGYMKRFLYSFWKNRNSNDPETAFRKYMVEVQKVNNSFGTAFLKGYESDRGKMYLKYGAPDVITDRVSEPSAYPYEIWNYYNLNNQSNVRFVFYMPDQGTGIYTLLHSDLRGELQNRRWETILFQRNNMFNVDQMSPIDQYGGWSRDLYNNPR